MGQHFWLANIYSCPSILKTYNSHSSSHTRESPWGWGWRGSGPPPSSAMSSCVPPQCEVTAHCPDLTVSPDGLSLTLDSELGPGLGTSAASGVRGQARPGPGLPCNRAPARGPSPQLIKVKRKNTNIVKKYKKALTPVQRGKYERKRIVSSSSIQNN